METCDWLLLNDKDLGDKKVEKASTSHNRPTVGPNDNKLEMLRLNHSVWCEHSLR